MACTYKIAHMPAAIYPTLIFKSKSKKVRLLHCLIGKLSNLCIHEYTY